MSVANGSSSSKTPVEDFKSEVVPATPSAEPGNPQPKVRKHRLGVDPSLIISDERSKRRRSPSPERENDDKHVVHDPKDPERAKQLGSQIYRKIMETKDSEGLSMSQPFVKLPNKRSLPDYYEAIKHPMSLEMVQRKLDAAGYETLKDVCADLGQIFNNAKRYNIKDSVLFIYAKKLHKMTRTFYSNVTSPEDPESDSEPEVDEPSVPMRPDTSGEGEEMDLDLGNEVDMGGPSTGSADGESNAGGVGKPPRKRGSYMKDGPTVYKLVKPVLKAIKEAKSLDLSGRDIAGIFMELPDRKLFADYFQTITNPISLQEIEDKMMARTYQTWEQFFDDVELMCSNAMVYNEDESEVYCDARQIKGILDWHRSEVKERLARPQIPKFRVKASTVTPIRMCSNLRPEFLSAESQRPTAFPPSPSAYNHQPSNPNPTPGPSSALPYLPALPTGVVNEEVVNSLDRYPTYEQQAWANSLPPLAMQVYRQILAKRSSAASQGPPQHATLADLPSSGRPNGVPSFPDRLAPPLPTIRCIDFSFSSVAQDPDYRQAIRLHNMRGVVTHAVVVGAETSEIELTAYVADARKGESVSPEVEVPEVSLRINGNQGSLPKFVFHGESKDRPTGMRWTVSVPTSRVETKIEVVAMKPGALTETSSIFINRQY